jgi:hypothetical protein
MDVVSYGVASKAAKQEQFTRNDVLGIGVEGPYPHVKGRIDNLEKAIQGVVAQADKLIVNDAINIMKAHAKLNAVARSMKYKMHNMIFDDLLDLSGIDTTKSSGFVHDATNGLIKSTGGNYIVETKTEVVDIVPSKIILIVEEDTPLYSEDITPEMFSSTLPVPYKVTSSNDASTSMAGWKAFDHDKINTLNAWATDSRTYSGWLQFDFGAGNKKIVSKYAITSINHAATANESSPKDWVFEGSNDGSVWVTLDTRTNITGWGPRTTKEFTFNNSTAYRYYRINVLATQMSNKPVCIQELEMMEKLSSENEFKGKYYISRDDGITWEPINPNTLFYFKDSISPLDNKLRLKAELPVNTQLLNYALTWA